MAFVILVKTATFAVYFRWLYVMCRMMFLGHRAHYIYDTHPTNHERYAPTARWTTVAMIGAASLSHIVIRRQIGGAEGMFFKVHLAGAILFCISLVLMGLFPGKTHHLIHRKVSRFLLSPTFICTALTGPILIWMM